MKKILVVYWSGTGNTEAMAKAIAKGSKEEVTLKRVEDATLADVKACDVLALGCPSMGAEVLEEEVMEPFVESIKEAVNKKEVALFGSYGWGDGEWMRNWEERMNGYGANIVADPIICVGEPNAHFIEELNTLGASL